MNGISATAPCLPVWAALVRNPGATLVDVRAPGPTPKPPCRVDDDNIVSIPSRAILLAQEWPKSRRPRAGAPLFVQSVSGMIIKSWRSALGDEPPGGMPEAVVARPTMGLRDSITFQYSWRTQRKFEVRYRCRARFLSVLP